MTLPTSDVRSSKETSSNWWQHATVYQIYPRSFCDANGDGIGDLVGITDKILYLEDLGVDAIWLTPFYPSPLRDGGCESKISLYARKRGEAADLIDDVANHKDVDPRIGTIADFREMVVALQKVNIKVLVDIVPNHTSSDHIWFKEALSASKDSDARRNYHFRDGEFHVIEPT